MCISTAYLSCKIKILFHYVFRNTMVYYFISCLILLISLISFFSLFDLLLQRLALAPSCLTPRTVWPWPVLGTRSALRARMVSSTQLDSSTRTRYAARPRPSHVTRRRRQPRTSHVFSRWSIWQRSNNATSESTTSGSRSSRSVDATRNTMCGRHASIVSSPLADTAIRDV